VALENMNWSVMKNILRNKLIIITGFSRSGTTILGKVLGSMYPAIYCFEPSLMKYLSVYGITDVPAKLLFETYFLNEIQGRGNMNPYDDSYSVNYLSWGDIISGRDQLRRRADAEKHIIENDYKFICKNTELQYQMEMMSEFFPGVRFIHIIRNGFNAVESAIARGWYTDDYCNAANVEDMIFHYKCDIPRFIDESCWESWPDWNAETRAACAWRSSVTSGIDYKHKYPNKCIQFEYEEFKLNPKEYVQLFEKKYGLKSTRLTDKHIADMGNFIPVRRNHEYLKKIAEPELSKFINLNKMIGYSGANET